MFRKPFCLGVLLLASHSLHPAAVTAQRLPGGDSLPGPFAPLVQLGSTAESRLRLDQALGRATPRGFLTRSAGTLTPELSREGSVAWSLVPARISTVWNSDLPFTFNDGGLWAGRGWSSQVQLGLRARLGSIRMTVAPELHYTQNVDFKAWPWWMRPDTSSFSAFASPWYRDEVRADLPVRFGNQPLATIDPGQSDVSVSVRGLTIGATSENEWWGPGVRNAIVLSNHAAGVPRLYARTARPLETGLGDFEARWMIGGLTESLYFDTISPGSARSFSGFAGTFTPSGEPNLTVGLARAVVAPVPGFERVFEHALDVFLESGRTPPEAFADPGRNPTTEEEFPPARVEAPDQITSIFARWVFPRDGFEVYTEWARRELPTSLRDFLIAPNHSQGYTLGLLWTRPVGERSAVRVEGELTYLEQSATHRARPVPSYYVSRTVPQGFTHRGQVLGASIGPGASSQWAAADYFAPTWAAGAFVGRIRWENDAYYESRPFYSWQRGRTQLAHDVSLFGGARSSLTVGPLELQLEYTGGIRYNYLFQNRESSFIPNDNIDVVFHSVRLLLSPATSWLSDPT